MRIVFCIVLLAGSACAQETGSVRDERLWKASMITLGIAHAVDTQSSWGKCEANGFIAGGSGRFDGRSAAMKSVFVGGLAVAELLTIRRHPKLYRLFTAVNFGVGAGLAGAAAHNFNVAPPGPGYTCVR